MKDRVHKSRGILPLRVIGEVSVNINPTDPLRLPNLGTYRSKKTKLIRVLESDTVETSGL